MESNLTIKQINKVINDCFDRAEKKIKMKQIEKDVFFKVNWMPENRSYNLEGGN